MRAALFATAIDSCVLLRKCCNKMLTLARPLAMASHGQPWLAMAGHGGP